MSTSNPDPVLDAIVADMKLAMPHRTVQRDLLLDPAVVKADTLTAGVICVVTEGGGGFANYRGREAQLGQMNVRLVGFLRVGEKSAPANIERAELALLSDWLAWLAAPSVPGLDIVYPNDWVNSKQLEHPFGWVTLSLTVKV